jgi:hypothetical protein
MRSKMTTLKLSQADQVLISMVRAHSMASTNAEAIRVGLRYYVEKQGLRELERFGTAVAALDELTKPKTAEEHLAKLNAAFPVPAPVDLSKSHSIQTPTMKPRRPKTTGRIK